MEDSKLLSVRNLRVIFRTYRGIVKALNGVNFEIGREEFVGIVGETGCGKSVTALSIMRLIQQPGEIIDGEIIFDGIDLLKLSEDEMRKVRGKEIAMIFQEPKVSLNPVLKVGTQLKEAVSIADGIPQKSREAEEKVMDILDAVGLPDPKGLMNKYPHELSGGMAQRVMIAMGLLKKPKLLIADEPTSALDVTIQAQILNLIKDLVSKFRTSVLFITHDLGVVAEMAHRVVVMYAGHKVEEGPVEQIIRHPQHPYTRGLLRCAPYVKADPGPARQILAEIPGFVPPLSLLDGKCPFRPRCPQVQSQCHEKMPNEVQVGVVRGISKACLEAE